MVDYEINGSNKEFHLLRRRFIIEVVLAFKHVMYIFRKPLTKVWFVVSGSHYYLFRITRIFLI